MKKIILCSLTWFLFHSTQYQVYGKHSLEADIKVLNDKPLILYTHYLNNTIEKSFFAGPSRHTPLGHQAWSKVPFPKKIRNGNNSENCF